MKGSYERVQESRRVQWLVSFLLFAAVAGVWALATPIYGAPDEASHVVRAADTIAEVAALMVRHRVRHVPLLDDGRIVGVLSALDLAHALSSPPP